MALHDALARIGSQLDTEVGVDAATLSIVTLSKFAGRALEILAGIVQRPRFDEADFVRVRDNRVSRLVQLRDVPGAVAERVFAWRLYGSHTYGHTALGSEAAVRVTTVDEVRAFHRDVYLGSRPTLVAVGDISHDEVVKLADRVWPAFAGSSRDASSASQSPAPPSTRSRIALVDRSGAAQSELRIGRVAAARATPDYPALTVMNTALGGAFVSRINLKRRALSLRLPTPAWPVRRPGERADRRHGRGDCRRAEGDRGNRRRTPDYPRGTGARACGPDPRLSAQLRDR
jgi:zinc protease